MYVSYKIYMCTCVCVQILCVVTHFALPYAVNLIFKIINSRLDFILMRIKFIVSPQFNIGDRKVTVGGTLAVRLSAEALTDPLLLTPGLDTSGYIEVDVTVEQGTTEPFALLGMLTAHTCLFHEVIHL